MANRVIDAMEHKQDVRFGPTYRFVHKECGHKASRMDMADGEAYVCERCDEWETLKTARHTRSFEKHRVDAYDANE